ncbi:unnamed protein product [Lota lota]
MKCRLERSWRVTGPSIHTSSSEAKAAGDPSHALTTPWQVLVSGSSLRAVFSLLLTQVSKLLKLSCMGTSTVPHIGLQ